MDWLNELVSWSWKNGANPYVIIHDIFVLPSVTFCATSLCINIVWKIGPSSAQELHDYAYWNMQGPYHVISFCKAEEVNLLTLALFSWLLIAITPILLRLNVFLQGTRYAHCFVLGDFFEPLCPEWLYLFIYIQNIYIYIHTHIYIYIHIYKIQMYIIHI